MRLKPLILGIVLLLGSIALAADAVPVYTQGKSQLYRDSIAIVDSAALDGASSIALPLITTGLHQNVRVTLKFSVASATCKIHFVRGESDGVTWSPKCKSSGTATADAAFTIGGKYVADDLIFDTGAYKYAKVIVEAPSSGTVDIGTSNQ